MIFHERNTIYLNIFKRSYFLMVIFIGQQAFAQKQGRVIDANNGEPLMGAVIENLSGETVTSNSDGTFIIQNPSDSVEVSFVGYKTSKFLLKEEFTDILLQASPTLINEAVIKSASGREKLKHSPGNVALVNLNNNIITTKQLLNEYINVVPGTFAHIGAMNTSRITIRGIGSRTPYHTSHISAYWNKIPLVNGEGAVDIEEIDEVLISRVQINKGANASMYGAGLGGGVLLNGSSNADGRRYASILGLQAGSYQYNKQYGKLYGEIKKLYYNFGVSRTQSNGYRQNSKYLRNTGTLDLKWYRKKLHLGLNLLAYDMSAEIPSSINYETFVNNPEQADEGWQQANGKELKQKLILGSFLRYSISPNWHNETVIYYTGTHAEEYRKSFMTIQEGNSNLGGVRNELQFHNGGFQVKWKNEYTYERYNLQEFENVAREKGERVTNNIDNRTAFNSALVGDWKHGDKVKIQVGANLNYTQYKHDVTFDSAKLNTTYPVAVSPFVGASYAASKYLLLFGNMSHGITYPTSTDIFNPDYNYQHNTELKPESGWMLEAGVRYSFIEGKLYGTAAFYHIKAKNLMLIEAISNDEFRTNNAGVTRHYGVESDNTYILRARPKHLLSTMVLRANYTYAENRFVDYMQIGESFNGNALPGLPKHILNANLKVGIYSQINFKVNYRFVGPQFLNDNNQETYNAYQLLNTELIWDAKLMDKNRLSVIFTVNNALNQHYASMLLVNAPSFGGSAPRYYYPGMPRHYRLGMEFGF